VRIHTHPVRDPGITARLLERLRCDDCGTQLGELLPSIEFGLPLCLRCYERRYTREGRR
jgi:hypothetical protein